MIYLVGRLTAAQVRARPGGFAAMAAALAVSAVLPSLVAAGWSQERVPSTGVLLSAVLAFTAVVGAVGSTEARDRVLAYNGARSRTALLLALASMVAPATLATALVLAVRPLLDPAPSPVATVLMCLVVPVMAAPVAVWFTARASGRRGRLDSAWSSDRRRPALVRFGVIVGIVGFVVLVPGVLFLAPVVCLMVGPLRVLTGPDGGSARARATSAALAVAVLAMCVVGVGLVRSWFNLFFVLLGTLPAAVAAVATLGIVVADGLARAGARLGGVNRLALAPVISRRAVLGPVIALVAAVAWLAVTNAVVGASFDAREAARPAEMASVSVPAGTSADQAIMWPGSVDPGLLRARLAETDDRQFRSVLIAQVGFGSDTVRGLLEETAAFSVELDLGPSRSPHQDWSSRWVGVVAAEDLAPLGWANAAEALADGRAVLVGGQELPADGRVRFRTPGGSVELPAASVPGRSAARLPGVIVSEEVASTLSSVRTVGRVVVVPEPPRAVTQLELLARGEAVRDLALALPTAIPTGLGADAERFDQFQIAMGIAGKPWAVLGDESVEVVAGGGPLNDVPLLSGNRDQGRARLAALAALPLVMTVAGVVLVLGSTRREDAVLAVQGATRSLRARASATQGLVLGLSTSILAGVLGVGIPALAFAMYNATAELPPIPLVVPIEVAAVLAALPLLAAAACAGIAAWRRAPGPDGESLDSLAW